MTLAQTRILATPSPRPGEITVKVPNSVPGTVTGVLIAVTAFVVFVERALRKILVNYAKRQVGNKVYQGQSSHLPLKLNMAGVIPPIFASSIILFPATLAQWFGSSENTIWLRDLAATLSPAPSRGSRSPLRGRQACE